MAMKGSLHRALGRAAFCANTWHTQSSLRPISWGTERLVDGISGLPFFSKPDATGVISWGLSQKLQSWRRWASESPVGPRLLSSQPGLWEAT